MYKFLFYKVIYSLFVICNFKKKKKIGNSYNIFI